MVSASGGCTTCDFSKNRSPPSLSPSTDAHTAIDTTTTTTVSTEAMRDGNRT
jgi:hypothetical protein